MLTQENAQGHRLVDDVRAAARLHNLSWEALVPDAYTINLAAEAEEERAYAAMAEVKRRLRDHICQTYGISIRELSSLAMP